MSNLRPILVTGAHRSGTTWVGRMLALSPQLGYINEPFSPICRPGICGIRFDKWFTCIGSDNGGDYEDALRRTLTFRYDLPAELKSLGYWEAPPANYPPEELKMLEDYSRFAMHSARGATPLMKDPISVFSAEWLADRFGMRVLVLIRHPGAFASSIRRLNWKMPFQNLLQQPLLMDGYLKPWRAEIEAQAASPGDIIDQAGLFWKCVYHTVRGYETAHPDWTFVRHEDICADPIKHYRWFYACFGLDWTPQIEAAILASSREENPAGWKDGDNPHALILNSRAVTKDWKKRLTREETLSLRRAVEEVSGYYYGDGDW